MSTINTKRQKNQHVNKSHKNWMGGESYDIGNPITNLRLAASSCFFGEPMYYHRDKSGDELNNTSSWALNGETVKHLREILGGIDPQEWRGLSPNKLMESAIDKALDYDVEQTLIEAVRLRNDENIRTTPQVILVRAANHSDCKGTGLVRQYAPDIIKRADEPSVCMAYQLSAYGKPIPNSLKKACRDAIGNFNDYQLAKYRMEGRVVKTVDVVNLVHPNRTHAVDGLAKGTLKISGRTWEAIRSSGGSWEEAIEVMGHMALLRNLRNFAQNKVNPDLYLRKLVDTADKGKQLPFRYYSAYKAIEDFATPNVLDAVETCLNNSLGNLPHFAGRTISLCDNSGSAWGNMTSSLGTMAVADIGNLTGVITGMVSDEGYVGVFGDNLKVIPIRTRSSIFDQVAKVSLDGDAVGKGTENGIWTFFQNAISKNEHWDNIFVYSDMQAGHGGLYGHNPTEYSQYCWCDGHHIDVASLIKSYRNHVNRNVNVFLVQTAGYQDTIVPEYFNKTYILGGWGDGILRFAGNMVNWPPGQ